MYCLVILEVRSPTWVSLAKIKVMAGSLLSGGSRGGSVPLSSLVYRDCSHSLARVPFVPSSCKLAALGRVVHQPYLSSSLLLVSRVKALVITRM